MNRASTFVVGIAMGAFGVLLAQRLKKSMEPENPESLVSRLSDQLSELERKIEDAAHPAGTS